MSTAHPVSPNASTSESRAPEPSMEEILASIRRIIADDQSLPGHVGLRDSLPPEPAGPGEAAGLLEPREPLDDRAPIEAPAPPSVREEPQVAPVHILRPEPSPLPPPEAKTVDVPTHGRPDPLLFQASAHGTISSPQFVSPRGPEPDLQLASVLPEPQPPAALGPAAAFEPPRRAAPEPELEPERFDYDEPLAPEAPEPPRDEPAPAPLLFSAATDKSLTSAFNMLAATRLADHSDELLAMTRELIRPMLKAWLDDNLPTMVERLVRAEIERVSRGGR